MTYDTEKLQYKIAAELLGEWASKLGSKFRQDDLKATRIMRCLSDNCSPSMYIWQSWSSSLILPSCFNQAPLRFFKLFGKFPVLDPFVVCSHLAGIVQIWSQQENGHHFKLDTEERLFSTNCKQAVILLCLTHLWSSLSNRSILRSKVVKLKKQIASSLSPIPVVLLDDGTFMKAAHFVIGIEADLSDSTKALPNYLTDVSPMFKLFGAYGLDSHEAQPIRITTINHIATPNFFEDQIAGFLNNKTLADVEIVASNTEDQEVILNAHKFILSLSSDVFRVMVSFNSKQSTSPIRIEARDTPAAAWLYLLSYSYTGKSPDEFSLAQWNRVVAQGEANGAALPFCNLYPPSTDSVTVVIALMQLADQYFYPFLKEWCEKYLDQPVVLTIQNVIDLFRIANAANAHQLANKCAKHLRSILHVATQLEEWSTLSEELKEKIVKGF